MPRNLIQRYGGGGLLLALTAGCVSQSTLQTEYAQVAQNAAIAACDPDVEETAVLAIEETFTGEHPVEFYVISALEGRAALIDQEQQLEQAVDDYAFVKNAYFENLEFKVTDGKSGDKAIEEEELENFEEFESMLEDVELDEDTQ